MSDILELEDNLVHLRDQLKDAYTNKDQKKVSEIMDEMWDVNSQISSIKIRDAMNWCLKNPSGNSDYLDITPYGFGRF